MKCSNVQKWLLFREDDEAKPPLFLEHIESCENCRLFQQRLLQIRRQVGRSESPEPDADLVQETKMLCHAAIRTQKTEKKSGLPKWIPVLVTIWMVTTLIFIGMTLSVPEPEWALPQKMALLFMVQNGLMLFFSPILLLQDRIKLKAKPAQSHGKMAFLSSLEY